VGSSSATTASSRLVTFRGWSFLASSEPLSDCCSHWQSSSYSAGFDLGAGGPDSRPEHGQMLVGIAQVRRVMAPTRYPECRSPFRPRSCRADLRRDLYVPPGPCGYPIYTISPRYVSTRDSSHLTPSFALPTCLSPIEESCRMAPGQQVIG